MTRILFALLFVAGIALGASPWITRAIADRPLGTWRVYEATAGFTPVEAQLASGTAPVAVSVEMTTSGLQNLPTGPALLTVTASTGGETVLAKALDFAGASSRDTNPQTQEKVFHTNVGVIDPVQPGAYTFTVTQGDADGVQIRAVDLILSRGATAFDKRLQPIGFSLAAIGFIGLVLAFRHRSGAPPPNPNSQPRPRWGRGE